MKRASNKIRGFVMTGGGAKGFYEAGVIHAFHITGMEFDVVTGSSIGAMNSIVYAEYLYRKRLLSEADRANPLTAIERMDPYVKAYHRTWLRLPNMGLLDDSEQGPIGKLKDNLADFNVSLAQGVRLAWWYFEPDRGWFPPPGLWRDLAGVAWQTIGRIKDPGLWWDIVRERPERRLKKALRSYLGQFELERALVPDGGDMALANAFTNPIRPLREDHLRRDIEIEFEADEPIQLIDPERTFRDYAQKDIDVRLTRANYRTGRLEVSRYGGAEDFVRFMYKHLWRLEAVDPTTIPLGSFRLQIPGNPRAIGAGLASGRYPGVFRPFPLDKIYPRSDPENKLLYLLVDQWLKDPAVEPILRQAYDRVKAERPEIYDWDTLWEAWNRADHMHGFFPLPTDAYVDGGAIDNTPSNPALDGGRDRMEKERQSRRDTELELFVVYLETEPRIDIADPADASLVDIVQRTLKILGVAKKGADAETVPMLNQFGDRAEALGRALVLVADRYREALDALPEAEREAAEERLHDDFRKAGVTVRTRQTSEDASSNGGDGQERRFVRKVSKWAEETVSGRLPLQVTRVTLYPDKMPLNTLQFTPRLLYNKKTAIEMLTLGCINTLFELRNHLETEEAERKKRSQELDAQDRRALDLARHWMGTEDWPAKDHEQQALRETWQCHRTECSFHAHDCSHGYRQPIPNAQ